MKTNPCRRFREWVTSLDREEGMRSGVTLSSMGTTGGFWSLEMRRVQSEMYHKCKIHTRFHRLSTSKWMWNIRGIVTSTCDKMHRVLPTREAQVFGFYWGPLHRRDWSIAHVVDLSVQGPDPGRPKASALSSVVGLSGVACPTLNHIVRLSTAPGEERQQRSPPSSWGQRSDLLWWRLILHYTGLLTSLCFLCSEEENSRAPAQGIRHFAERVHFSGAWKALLFSSPRGNELTPHWKSP